MAFNQGADTNSMNGNHNAATQQNVAADYSNRNSSNGTYSPSSNNSTRFSPRRGRAQPREKEPVRGPFEIIGISDTGEQIVALETGWKNDLKKLTEGMAGYTDFYKPGIDDMEPNGVYACKVGEIWRRCRMVSRHGPGGFLVELIDVGGSQTVTRGEVLTLSQLYKDWSIKSVDVFFTGYSTESNSETAKELSAMLLNNTFQLGYTHERTGPLQRDRIFVTEMKHQNENMLDSLIEKGFLKRLPPQQEHQQLERPPSQQGAPNRQQRYERFPLRSQRPITKSGQGPQRFDTRSKSPYEESGQGLQQGADGFKQFEQHISPPIDNGWGDVEIRRDDTGAECWASPPRDVAGNKRSEWNDQRENQDPQTSWGTAKQWTSSEWDYNTQPTQSTSTEPATHSKNHSPQNQRDENRQPASEWECSPEPTQRTSSEPAKHSKNHSPQYQRDENPQPASEWEYSPEPTQRTSNEPAKHSKNHSPQYQRDENRQPCPHPDWEYSPESTQRTSSEPAKHSKNYSPQYQQDENRQPCAHPDWEYSAESTQRISNEPAKHPKKHSTQYQRDENRPVCTNLAESSLSRRQVSKGRALRPAQSDVFSSAGDWNRAAKKEPPRANELHRRVENLSISGGDPAVECERCIQLTNKVNTLESKLYGPAVQQLISTRLTNISAELRQVKVHLAQLRLDPTAQDTEIGRDALARCRREGRIRVKEVEDLLTRSSAETLTSFGMNGWSQFVGVIWTPMMDLQYLDERPLCVFKSTVIRRVVLEDDDEPTAIDLSQRPSQNVAERATVLLERAIEIPKMFPVLQNLAPNRAQGRVNSVFFSEDNSKVFIQLECPQSAEEDLEEYAKSTLSLLSELGIIDL